MRMGCVYIASRAAPPQLLFTRVKASKLHYAWATRARAFRGSMNGFTFHSYSSVEIGSQVIDIWRCGSVWGLPVLPHIYMESLKAFSLTLWPVRKNAVLGIAVICGQLLHYIPHLGCIMCKNGTSDLVVRLIFITVQLKECFSVFFSFNIISHDDRYYVNALYAYKEPACWEHNRLKVLFCENTLFVTSLVEMIFTQPCNWVQFIKQWNVNMLPFCLS